MRTTCYIRQPRNGTESLCFKHRLISYADLDLTDFRTFSGFSPFSPVGVNVFSSSKFITLSFSIVSFQVSCILTAPSVMIFERFSSVLPHELQMLAISLKGIPL